MDLQTRKLKAIEYLIGLRDEKLFRKIESTIVEVQKQQTSHRSEKPFSVEQLVDRANRSTRDYLAGNYKTQEQLEKESENW
ncbi:hypothetical protein [Natronoflexus pectinivorans]|uniref:Uncharacterized protein n=1 Tax=Natronoflexus pectinivorans TaxID=682526 RepID=A0A4R2GLF7_9BACT|nr:hypothetical protein [Natronoflexus pectinivorans]TCO09824.1 hypothetical protein EV194_102253 [Natronoflexus pectinivorans]